MVGAREVCERASMIYYHNEIPVHDVREVKPMQWEASKRKCFFLFLVVLSN